MRAARSCALAPLRICAATGPAATPANSDMKPRRLMRLLPSPSSSFSGVHRNSNARRLSEQGENREMIVGVCHVRSSPESGRQTRQPVPASGHFRTHAVQQDAFTRSSHRRSCPTFSYRQPRGLSLAAPNVAEVLFILSSREQIAFSLDASTVLRG